MFAMFGWEIQSVFLHQSTYTYVQRMAVYNKTLGPKLFNNTLQFQTVNDPLESAMFGDSPVHVALPILDMVAAAFPASFMLVSLYGFRYKSNVLQVWIKVMMCAGLLFITKGTLDAMTNVPDSSGWNVCAGRLKEEGLEYMRKHHTLWDFFGLDYWWVKKHHSLLRYCSDMILSGHTFVVTLFAMGLYEQLRVVLGVAGHYEVSAHNNDSKYLPSPRCRKIHLSTALLALVSVVAIVEQAVEICVVGMSRFHYSVDMATALVITFLMYTNSAIAMVSKQFELRGMYYFIGAWPKHSKIDPEKQKPRYKEWPYLDVWSSKGDVYIPWCCIPFCCISGRAHVYGDDGILELMVANEIKVPIDFQHAMQESELPKFIDHLRRLVDDMNLFEGVSARDLWDVVPCKTEKIKKIRYIQKLIEETSRGNILYKDHKDIHLLQDMIRNVGGDAEEQKKAYLKIERQITQNSRLTTDEGNRADAMIGNIKKSTSSSCTTC
jgi:hypothetical protein